MSNNIREARRHEGPPMTPCVNSPTGRCQLTSPCQHACQLRVQPLPVQHYTVPMSDERVRLIVRDELVRCGVLVKPVID